MVLMGVQMPAALVEIGFITNAREEQALAAAAERERIADGLVARGARVRPPLRRAARRRAARGPREALSAEGGC